MSLFKAKLHKTAKTIDVIGRSIIVNSPRQENVRGVGKDIGKDIGKLLPAQIDYQIEGMSPIELTPAEWRQAKTFFIKILRKSNEITEIEEN